MADEPAVDESSPAVTAGDTTRAPSRRERARAATVEEIKQTALALMREHGTTDFHFSDIARAMGMTAPALYRYFADRDELLTALIVDAYDDLADAVATQRELVPVDDPGGRFVAVCQAYRRWARDDSARFALILGLPVPGYSAPEEGPTTEASRRAMTQLKSLFFQAAEQGVLGRATLPAAAEVEAYCAQPDHPADPAPGHDVLPAETFVAMLHCWSTLHGFASLEAYGHLDWLPEAVRDQVFLSSVRTVATAAGLPTPHRADP